jgi:hypothetical protein
MMHPREPGDHDAAPPVGVTPLTAFSRVAAKTHRLSYCAMSDEWSFMWSCPTCGCTELPLFAMIEADGLADALASASALVGLRGCPGCETRRRRTEPDSWGVWYDTIVHDWVLREPRQPGEAAIQSLMVRSFDYPDALLRRIIQVARRRQEGASH